MVKKRLVLWFRNDLRLKDNCIIHEAVKRVKSKEYDEVGAIRQQAQIIANRQCERTLLITEPRVQTSLLRVCLYLWMRGGSDGQGELLPI
jgi:deoxyribodipyrimidine photolyase